MLTWHANAWRQTGGPTVETLFSGLEMLAALNRGGRIKIIILSDRQKKSTQSQQYEDNKTLFFHAHQNSDSRGRQTPRESTQNEFLRACGLCFPLHIGPLTRLSPIIRKHCFIRSSPQHCHSSLPPNNHKDIPAPPRPHRQAQAPPRRLPPSSRRQRAEPKRGEPTSSENLPTSVTLGDVFGTH